MAAAGKAVKSRRQAIAIALSEGGASKYDSARGNRRHFSKSARKEARGKTGQQEREGRSHVGARGRKAARTRAHRADGTTKAARYWRAKRARNEGRSKMSKRQLENALRG